MSNRTMVWRLRVALVFVVALVVVVMVPRLLSAKPLAAPRCFAETNQCIDGRFRTYWEQNGGLAVFGFPITPQREERNRDTGRVYQTQWFERNRFELHPENAAPYDVLLGRLGDDRLVQQNRNWQAAPREGRPRAGCLWFGETGRNVCDQASGAGFMTYWRTHGLQDARLDAHRRSLALLGLPLTGAATETNSSGDRVQTQWFERGRLEWHPNNPREFRVLLGLLGNEVLRNNPGPQPTADDRPAPTATDRPAPTATAEPEPTAAPTRTPTRTPTNPPAPTSTSTPTATTPATPTATPTQTTPPPSPLKRRDTPPGGVAGAGNVSFVANFCNVTLDAGSDVTLNAGGEGDPTPHFIAERLNICFSKDSFVPGVPFSVEFKQGESVVESHGIAEVNQVDEGSLFRWVPRPGYPFGPYVMTARQGELTATLRFAMAPPATPGEDGRILVIDVNNRPGSVIQFVLGGFVPGVPVPLYLYGEVACPADHDPFLGDACFMAELPPAIPDARGEATYSLPTQADDPLGEYFVSAAKENPEGAYAAFRIQE